MPIVKISISEHHHRAADGTDDLNTLSAALYNLK